MEMHKSGADCNLLALSSLTRTDRSRHNHVYMRYKSIDFPKEKEYNYIRTIGKGNVT
jgi:hypothetical protein